MNHDDFSAKILGAARDGALVLTATRRLARHLLDLYRQERVTRGRTAWLSPAIMSSQDWVNRQLVLLGDDWRVLTPAASRRLWEETIENDARSAGLDLLQVAASASRAEEAHQLLLDYRGNCGNYLLSEDHQAFLRWRQGYLKRLHERGWLDGAASTDRVLAALATGQLPPPPFLLLVGFDELPPGMSRLATLVADSNRVEILPPPRAPIAQSGSCACDDAAAEVRTAARWVRHLLGQGECRIGVVAPDLSNYRDLIDQIFLEELDPLGLLALDDMEGRFGLSLGVPLGQQGPVMAALQLLSCDREPECGQLGVLLRTPYLGGGVREEAARSRFDVALRRLRRERVPLQGLLAATGSPWALPPGFARILRELLRFSALGRKETPAFWVQHFRSVLNNVGWPGDRPLDSRDFQVVKAWEEKLLPRFASLDGICRPLDRQEAVGLLRRLALEEEFQLEMPNPGIQVCGVLEAGGLSFDHLWILGLHENAWPPPPRPNPFLPRRLQIDLGMPHADAGREAGYARMVLQRLLATAPRVVCSYPQQEAGCPLRPSPLLAGILPVAPELAPTVAPAPCLERQGAALQGCTDPGGPALPAGSELPGGTAVLRDQALCPFRGFARHRLGARALETPVTGIDPATRGTLVHTCLELLWGRVSGHAQLRLWSEEERHLQVAASVDEALARHFEHPLRVLAPAQLTIERERLTNLVNEWLTAIEFERPAAAVASFVEEEQQAEFGGLSIGTKIDRRDILADGRSLILDYKTGKVDLDDLLGERLLEPQLPIYAVGQNVDQLAGIAIGQVRRGECLLKGVAREGEIFAGIRPFAESREAGRHGLGSWAELLGRWRLRLDELGRQVLAGAAAVDPVSDKKACRYCDLQGFCRIGDRPDGSAGEKDLP
ncbi:PD-(D/E)XK nuclease family protein [Desulfuromonas carbonis]|uniref:PD-(D/E)XK nuclease family protein n=1 Tax=Desulfuromonas sp. DDH964 TaxID=1823759 RepID=UPI00078B1D48|nr:PD-(D/E)XK nuclease family protein [Desulfuromonas sp. DDH964]AMV72257.1 hypothetical protein DBW_1904 [Desulfuromonas sp. DDH964]